MDRHFTEAWADQNVPLHLALIELWNTNALGHTSRVVLPYAQALLAGCRPICSKRKWSPMGAQLA